MIAFFQVPIMFLTNSICLDVVMTGAIDARYETSSSGWLVQMLFY